jgi:hypothetical protein
VFFPRRRFQNKGTHNTHPRQARDGSVAAKHIPTMERKESRWLADFLGADCDGGHIPRGPWPRSCCRAMSLASDDAWFSHSTPCRCWRQCLWMSGWRKTIPPWQGDATCAQVEVKAIMAGSLAVTQGIACTVPCPLGGGRHALLIDSLDCALKRRHLLAMR